MTKTKVDEKSSNSTQKSFLKSRSALLLLVAVLALAGALLMATSSNESANQQPNEDLPEDALELSEEELEVKEAEVKEEVVVDEALNNAEEYYESDEDKAREILNDALAKVKEDNSKQMLYLALAGLCTDETDCFVENVINAEKHGEFSGYEDKLMAAEAHKQAGNKDKALKYLEEVLAELENGSAQAEEFLKDFVKAEIKELEG